jgi:cytochrome c553
VRRFVLVFLLSSSIVLPVVAGSAKVRTAIGDKKVDVQPITQGDASAGKYKSENERCQECHGSDGNANSNGPEGRVAKLAGQYPEYIVKQIRDFRTGERKHDFMSMMAKSIDDADLADIAAYFARQNKMHGDGNGDNAVGKDLFVNGNASRNILPCISCHASGGTPVGNPRSPVIEGQEWRYLEKQMIDWRSGERNNSTNGVMNKIAKSLTDAEIQALADYISGR